MWLVGGWLVVGWWLVGGWLVVCFWYVVGMFLVCFWYVVGMFLVCFWYVGAWIVGCLVWCCRSRTVWPREAPLLFIRILTPSLLFAGGLFWIACLGCSISCADPAPVRPGQRCCSVSC